MEKLTLFIVEYQEAIIAVLTYLIIHFSASIITALTKTRNTKWYKLLEVIALVVKKAKDKSQIKKK